MTKDVDRPPKHLIAQAEAFETANDWQRAAEIYEQILTQLPLEAEIWFRIGACLRNAGNTSDSLQFFEKASMLAPEHLDYEFEHAAALVEVRDLARAISIYAEIKERDPTNITAISNMGTVLKEAGQYEDALLAFQNANRLAPDDPQVQANYAAVLLKFGRIDEALTQLDKSLSQNAGFAEAWSTRGVALQEVLDIDGALASHREALALSPENHAIHYNYAMTLLLNGEFKEGFAEFEHRQHMPDRRPRRFQPPQWHGEDLKEKELFIHAEQGVGDTIQFVRFLPRLSELCGKLTLSTHSSVATLLRHQFDDIHVQSEGDALPNYDFHSPLLSVPNWLDPELSILSEDWHPYLSAPSGSFTAIRPSTDRLKVGIVWAGNPNHANDSNRSCSFSEFLPLFELDGIDWYSLQVGERTVDLQKFDTPIIDLSPELNDFASTAQAINALDLTLSVDTSVVHLAGAMGAPVWCLVSYAPDWRWQLNRDTSRWYPSMKLFRQTQRGDWAELMTRVLNGLKSEVSNRPIA